MVVSYGSTLRMTTYIIIYLVFLKIFILFYWIINFAVN